MESWKKFWFEPISAYPLAVFRIAFGAVMLVNLIFQYLPFYDSFYGPNSLISISSIYVYKWHDMPVFDLLALLPNTNLSAYLFLIGTILFALFVTFGFATRISTIGLFLCILSLNNHNPFIIHAGDNYARLVLLFLAFSPCGKVLSVDNLISKDKRTTELIEPWAMRLIQVQFCFIYLVNWLSKMDSKIWTEGEAVYYATRLQQYYRFDYPEILDNIVAVKMLTWSTLVIEFALIFLLWPKKIRYYMIAIGIAFHLSLDLVFNLGVFEWFFIASFLLFIDSDVYKKIKGKLVVIGKKESQLEDTVSA